MLAAEVSPLASGHRLAVEGATPIRRAEPFPQGFGLFFVHDQSAPNGSQVAARQNAEDGSSRVALAVNHQARIAQQLGSEGVNQRTDFNG